MAFWIGALAYVRLGKPVLMLMFLEGHGHSSAAENPAIEFLAYAALTQILGDERRNRD
jgi:hypothetical protein